MNDLSDIWKKLSTDKLETDRHAPALQWPPQSKHPIRKLLRTFQFVLLFSLAFEGIWIYFLIVFRQPEVRIFLGLMIIGYLFFIFVNLKVYRNIRHETDFSENLLVTFKKIYELTTRTLAFQRKAALFIYPVAGSAGFLLGFASKKEPSRVFDEPWLLTTMIVVSLLLTPVAYYIARWVDKKAYGKYCDQLKGIIDDMEGSEKIISND